MEFSTFSFRNLGSIPPVRLRACLKRLCLSEAIEHKACCGDFDECLRALYAVLVILVQSSISAKPGEAALHNPGEACDLERRQRAFKITGLDTSLDTTVLPGSEVVIDRAPPWKLSGKQTPLAACSQ